MPPDLLALTGRQQSSARTAPLARLEDRLATLLAATSQLGYSIALATPVEAQRYRRLLAAERDHAGVAEALRMLDAVLDSPLDLDAPLLERIRSTLRVELPPTTGEPEAAPPNELAALASQMQGMTRLMRQQAGSVQQGHLAAEDHRTRQKSGDTVGSTTSVPNEETPTHPVRSQIRGLHVRQGGHHFVLPIDKIERALDVKVCELPTVRGKAVAHVSGEMCDVVHLAGHLGLMSQEESSANTLIVISEAGSRVCLAIDEVMGPVETTVTPMSTVLPKVTGVTGVATLDSGGLALVPDLSRLV